MFPLFNSQIWLVFDTQNCDAPISTQSEREREGGICLKYWFFESVFILLQGQIIHTAETEECCLAAVSSRTTLMTIKVCDKKLYNLSFVEWPWLLAYACKPAHAISCTSCFSPQHANKCGWMNLKPEVNSSGPLPHWNKRLVFLHLDTVKISRWQYNFNENNLFCVDQCLQLLHCSSSL